jgi:hypothetical protein
MSKLLKLTLIILALYPLFGYLSLTFFSLEPYLFNTVLIFICIILFLSKNNIFIFSNYIAYKLLYLLMVASSMFVFHSNPNTVNSDLVRLLEILNAIILFILIENTSFSESFIKLIKTLLLFMVFFAAFTSIVQYYNPSFFSYTSKYTGSLVGDLGYERRIMSIFTWGDVMNTQYLAIGFACIYGILIYEFRDNKYLSLTLPILVGVVMFLSGYRVAMLTFVIISLTLFINRISFKMIISIFFIIISFYTLLDFLEYDISFFVEARLKSESALTRIKAFDAFFNAFPENPFFGTGGERTQALFEGFGHVARMHNVHLNIAYYYGIFALLFHTVFFLLILNKTYKTGIRYNYWPPFAGLIAYFAASFTTPQAIFYIPGLIFIFVFNKYYQDKHNYNDAINKNILKI